MFVATLIANPAKAPLPADLVANLRDVWGGAESVWLSPAEAAEFALPARPAPQWQDWDDVASRMYFIQQNADDVRFLDI